MQWQRAAMILIALLLAGCGAKSEPPAPGPLSQAAAETLVSGRYVTRQGRFQIRYELLLHADGRVTRTQLFTSTHRFAERWDELAAGGRVGKGMETERAPGSVAARSTETFDSVADYNQQAEGGPQVAADQTWFYQVLGLGGLPEAPSASTLLELWGPHEQATLEDWLAYLEHAVDVEYVITDERSGKQMSWRQPVVDAWQGATVDLFSKRYLTGAYVLGGGFAAVLLFVAYMGLFGRRHWDPNWEA